MSMVIDNVWWREIIAFRSSLIADPLSIPGAPRRRYPPNQNAETQSFSAIFASVGNAFSAIRDLLDSLESEILYKKTTIVQFSTTRKTFSAPAWGVPLY